MFGLSRRERWQKLKMRETEVLASLVATAIQARPQIDRARIDELECVVSDLARQVEERNAEIARLRAENRTLTVFRDELAHRNAELWERAENDRARLDWIVDNMRQTDLMLMLPKYTGNRSSLYAAIDAARNHSEPVQKEPAGE